MYNLRSHFRWWLPDLRRIGPNQSPASSPTHRLCQWQYRCTPIAVSLGCRWALWPHLGVKFSSHFKFKTHIRYFFFYQLWKIWNMEEWIHTFTTACQDHWIEQDSTVCLVTLCSCLVSLFEIVPILNLIFRFQCKHPWLGPRLFDLTFKCKNSCLIDWHNVLLHLNSAFGFPVQWLRLPHCCTTGCDTMVVPFLSGDTSQGRRFWEKKQTNCVPPTAKSCQFVCMKVSENKGLFIGCKIIIPLLRMLKNQRHLLVFGLIVHVYRHPGRCRRLFLQPPASHPDVHVLNPLRNQAGEEFSAASGLRRLRGKTRGTKCHLLNLTKCLDTEGVWVTG